MQLPSNCGHDSEALDTEHRCSAVRRTAFRRCGGVNLSETSLFELVQLDLARLHSAPQLFERLAGLGKGAGISFFQAVMRAFPRTVVGLEGSE